MAQTIRLKRSAVAAKAPLTTDLALGELAINTFDGKMYFKKNVTGTDSIVTLANDNEVVKLTGDQTIAGAKTFNANLIVSSLASWCNFGPTTISFGHNGFGGSPLVYVRSPSDSANGGILRFGTNSSGSAQTTPKGSIQNLGTPADDYDAANKKYVDDQVATKANTSHTHAASDIISGTIATARLGSGTANNTTFLRGDNTWAVPAGGGGGISDGNKGDITVSSSGTVWTIDNTAVTYAKIQNVSATSRLLGRATASAGVIEEITIGSGLTLTGSTLEATGTSSSIPDFIYMNLGVV